MHLAGTNASPLRTDASHSNWTFADESDEPSHWSLQLGELRMAKATLELDDRITKADVAISIEPLAKAIPFAELVAVARQIPARVAKRRPCAMTCRTMPTAWTVAGSYRGASVQATGKIGSVLTPREGK